MILRTWYLHCLFGLLIPLITNSQRLSSSFRAQTTINNVFIKNDKIYVGAVNGLYVLNSSDLALQIQQTTGPELDSPFCSPDLTSCIGSRDSIREENNYNKVIQFSPSTGLLLVCGSIRQGTCQWRHPDSLQVSNRFESSIPVSANSANASTVSLLVQNDLGEDNLFVAASLTDSPYRDSFPAVATRGIPSLNTLNAGSLEGEAAVFIRNDYRPRFRIRYVTVFEADKYVYFVAVQSRDVKFSLLGYSAVSRLIRVCKDDDKYMSYSEIEMQCRGEDNTNFNIVNAMKLIGDELVGLFEDSTGQKSAVCFFHMPKIRTALWYNMDRCWSGTATVGLPHIGRDNKCLNRSRISIPEDSCAIGVGSTIELSQIAAKRFDNRQLTSVDGRIVQGHFLLAVGSLSGDVLQFDVKGDVHSRKLSEPFAEFVAGPDPVSKVIYLDDQRLLTVSGNEVLAFKASVCPQSATCEECMSSGDPLCGFCLSSGTCSAQDTCSTTLVQTCPRLLNSDSTNNVSIGAPSSVSLSFTVQDLPILGPGLEYDCIFGGFRSVSERSHDKIQCPLPAERPTLTGEDAIVPLSLRTPFSQYDIVQKNITFFNCRAHSVCSKCSKSEWPCEWCESDRTCNARGEHCSVKGSGQCPHIDMADQPVISVPDGTNQSISLSVRHIRSDADMSGLSCTIHSKASDGHVWKTAAKFVAKDKVQCDSVLFKYDEFEPEHNYSLELRKNDELLDKVPIVAYKCNVMASDCSNCIALEPRLKCTWCAGGCHYANHCPVRPARSKPDGICTSPIIHSVSLSTIANVLQFNPSSGPVEGGTRIEIIGRDLGSRIQDVQDRVMVGQSKCNIVEYEVSVRIVCVVDPGVGSGPVRITIGRSGRIRAESTEHFHFLEPTLRSVQPGFGPVSGGTRLQLFGENLDVGRNVTVFIDDIPCEVVNDERSRDKLTCMTSATPSARVATTVRLTIDDKISVLNNRFEYKPDPTIDSVFPLTAFESGGRMLTVKGSNFDSIQEAKIFLVSGSGPNIVPVSDLGACQVINDTHVTCESPKLSRNLLNAESHQGRHSFNKFPIGFVMDGVKSVRNLGKKFSLMTVADPQFAPFSGYRTLSLGQPLVLEGRYLSLSAQPEEYLVTIGTEECPVILLEPHQLICRTPETLPPATDELGVPLKDGRSLVVVRFGSGRIRAEIGPLEFADGPSIRSSVLMRANMLRLVIMLVCGIGVVGLGMVLLFVLWRRRSNEHERDYKRIQVQMEQMECNVRNECKQAFAELQTDMLTDMNLTMDAEGVPFHERAEFFARHLFKDGIDTSILGAYGTAGIYATHMPNAIIQFESLLYNRNFIFSMVQMVESNPSISASERTTLSSLLMVPLTRDMTYCTDVVFTLLTNHIRTSCQHKSAHLLFRRSESLVEKLFQHWLAFTLFPAITESVGPARHLYLLYRALKFQTEKGPVDAVSGNARYSLSEQRLLRESVDAVPIMLLIIPLECFDQSPVQVRVLDCDTISQVKAKLLDALYKNEPFSRRLTVDQFDLEWRCPRRGNILLMDDDQPHLKTVKRLHTVSHYDLQANSVLAMQQRGQHVFPTFRSESGGSSDTTCSVWSSSHLLEQGLPTSPNSHCSATQYFHITPPASIKVNMLQSHASALLSLDSMQKKRRILRRPSSQQHLFLDDTSQRNIPEVFLTRMVMCKGTVQQFIDEFMNAVMFNGMDVGDVPVVLKYVLDYLDQQAILNNVNDEEVVHAWKTNAYVLRFWVQLLNNTDTLFDIRRQSCVDSSLVVIGQTLVDSFSHSDVPLCKESPSSKLLFAKDVARFRPIASRLFARIRQQPRVDNDKFFGYIETMNNGSANVSQRMVVNELLSWSKANILRLTEILDQDPVAVKLRLGERLQETARSSSAPSEPPDHIYATLQ